MLLRHNKYSLKAWASQGLSVYAAFTPKGVRPIFGQLAKGIYSHTRLEPKPALNHQEFDTAGLRARRHTFYNAREMPLLRGDRT